MQADVLEQASERALVRGATSWHQEPRDGEAGVVLPVAIRDDDRHRVPIRVAKLLYHRRGALHVIVFTPEIRRILCGGLHSHIPLDKVLLDGFEREVEDPEGHRYIARSGHQVLDDDVVTLDDDHAAAHLLQSVALM